MTRGIAVSSLREVRDKGKRDQGVCPGITVVTRPSSSYIAYSTSGLPWRTASRLRSRRSAKRGAATTIAAAHQVGDIGFADVFWQDFNLDIRIEFAEAASGPIQRAVFAEPVGGHQQLAVEVVQPQVSRMGQDEATDAGGGKLERRRAAHSADARDQHRGPFESFLPLFAKIANRELPGVAHSSSAGDRLRDVGITWVVCEVFSRPR